MAMDRNKLIKYWIQSSDMDYQTMLHLFEKGDYTWALFIGHLVIEKLIKAIFAHTNAETPPYIHDLFRLAEKCKLDIDEAQKDTLDALTAFNIRARYDDYKMEFYNKCTKDFTEMWIQSIKELRIWLKEHHISQY